MEPIRSQVQDWMTKQPITISPESSAVEAYERMRAHKVHRLPVIDPQGHLVGIITRSDIEGVVSFQRTEQGWHEARFALAGTTVAEVMTGDPITVTATTSMRQATQLLLDHHLSGLPVVDGTQLVGILSESDVFRMVVRLCDD
ncbi:MAG: CBS domain-containing protein [Oscillochloridaceae bacterium umkhey_bin13]